MLKRITTLAIISLGIGVCFAPRALHAEHDPIPGTVIPTHDPYDGKDRAPNPLYLDTLTRKPWALEGADYRVPVVVAEPVGLARRKAPVSVRIELPGNTAPSSIRVVTPYGEEIPSQVRVLEEGKRSVEVLFLLRLVPWDQAPMFIYCGGQETKTPEYPVPLSFGVQKGRDCYHLTNDRIRVALDKEKGRVKSLVPVGGSDNNQLGEFFPFIGGDGNVGSPGGKPEITEDGPIRKTLSFAHESMRTEFSLYRSSPMLQIRLLPVRPRHTNSHFIWAPRGDCRKDHFYYESTEGIRKCRIRYEISSDLKNYGIPNLKEGWFAYEDERGEVAGEIFEPGNAARMYLYQHGTGFRVGRTAKSAAEHRSALVTGTGDYRLVRESYTAWKNPPMVIVGKPQSKVDLKPKVPVFGEDFIRLHYSSYTSAWGFTRLNEHSALEVVREIQRFGGDYLGFFCRQPFWEHEYQGKTIEADPFITKELIPTAHANGLGVEVGLGPHGCPVARRKHFVENTRRIATSGIDMLSLLDEYGFTLWSEEAKEKFRKDFGMEPPDEDYRDKPEMLADEKCQNLCLFRINEIASLVKDMSQAAREANPKLVLFLVTSPNNLIITRHGYHDLETFSSYLDFTNSDLYSAHFSFLRYYVKYIRGSMGNNRPVLTVYAIHTSDGTPGFAGTRLQIMLQTFWGSNSLWGFSMVGRRWEGDRGLLGAKYAYDVLNYSGLGKYLASANPIHFVGVLRDRDAFIDGIKKGEAAAGGAYEHHRVRGMVCSLGDIPVDIVFSKYLPSLTDDGYKVVIVPNDPVLSPANAAHLRKYVEQGGNLIIEAEGLNSPIIQEMAKVGWKEGERRSVGQWELRGAASPFDDLRLTVRGPKFAIANKGADVLVKLDDGTPAVTQAKCGQGRVVYTPLLLSESGRRSAELGRFLRQLTLYLSGPKPASLVNHHMLDTNVLINRKRKAVIIPVFNHSPREENVATIALDRAVLGIPDDCEVTELTEGHKFELDGDTFSAPVRPHQVKFFAITAPGQIPLLEAGASPAGQLAYSAHPGMEFLKQKVSRTSRASAERAKERGKTYVGIFKGIKGNSLCDWGTEAMYEEAKALKGVVAEYIEDVTEREASFYDVIIMPNRLDGSLPPNKEWPEVLRDFVQEGGSALMVHHAIGRNPPYPTVFPEVGTCGPMCIPITTMQVVKEHPVTTGESYRKRFPDLVKNPAFSVQMHATQFSKDELFEDGFPDYFAVVPAEGSEVLVKSVYDKTKNQGDDATVVVGKFGKGKVVLAAMGIGCLCKKVDGKWQGEEKCTDGERKILVNSIYWLGEK